MPGPSKCTTCSQSTFPLSFIFAISFGLNNGNGTSGTGRYNILLHVIVVAATEGNVVVLQNTILKWDNSFALLKLHFGPDASCL